ncbi:MAG: hypothetical protein AAGH41_08765 [Pseudomonadota bacterium]
MASAFAVSLLAVSLALWIESGQRRAVIGRVQGSAALQKRARWLGWAFALASLVVLALAVGWELGIPLWLAWLNVVAAISLIAMARFPRTHWWVGGSTALVSLILGGALTAGGVL